MTEYQQVERSPLSSHRYSTTCHAKTQFDVCRTTFSRDDADADANAQIELESVAAHATNGDLAMGVATASGIGARTKPDTTALLHAATGGQSGQSGIHAEQLQR